MPTEGWDRLVDEALATELAGDVDPAAVDRLEARLERLARLDRLDAAAAQESADLPWRWAAAWLLMASALVALHVRVAAADYAALLAALEAVTSAVPLGLLGLAAAAVALVELVGRAARPRARW